jgi:hypothetical protein
MCSEILTIKGKEISRTSVIPLFMEDRSSRRIQEQIKEFDQSLSNTLGDRAAGLPVNAMVADTPEYKQYIDNTMTAPLIVKDADEHDFDTYHKLLSARALLPRGD